MSLSKNIQRNLEFAQAGDAFTKPGIEQLVGRLQLSSGTHISHPIAVAMILADLGMDDECIQAALLHDVVEDTEIPLEQISRQFGSDVALLVNGVTKLGQISYQTSREERQCIDDAVFVNTFGELRNHFRLCKYCTGASCKRYISFGTYCTHHY